MGKHHVTPLVYILLVWLPGTTAMSSSHRDRRPAQDAAHLHQDENDGLRDGNHRMATMLSNEMLHDKSVSQNMPPADFLMRSEGLKAGSRDDESLKVTISASWKGEGFTWIGDINDEPSAGSDIQYDHVNKLMKTKGSQKQPLSSTDHRNSRVKARQRRETRRRQSRRHGSRGRQSSAAISSSQHINSLPHSASQIGPKLLQALPPGSSNVTARKLGAAVVPSQPSAHFQSFSLFSSATSLDGKRPRRPKQRGTSTPLSVGIPTTISPSSEHHLHHQQLLLGQQRNTSGDLAALTGHYGSFPLRHHNTSAQEPRHREENLHTKEQVDVKINNVQGRLQECQQCDLDLRMLRAAYKKNLETLKLVLMEAMDRFILDPSQLLTSALCDVLNIPSAHHSHRGSFTSAAGPLRPAHGPRRHPHGRRPHDNNEARHSAVSLVSEESRPGVSLASESRPHANRGRPHREEASHLSQNARTSDASGIPAHWSRPDADGIGRHDSSRGLSEAANINVGSSHLRGNEQRGRYNEQDDWLTGRLDLDAKDNARTNSALISALPVDHVTHKEIGESGSRSAVKTTESPRERNVVRSTTHDQSAYTSELTGRSRESSFSDNSTRNTGVGTVGQVRGNQFSSRGSGLSVEPGDSNTQAAGFQDEGGLLGVANISQISQDGWLPHSSRQPAASSDTLTSDPPTSNLRPLNDTRRRSSDKRHASAALQNVTIPHLDRKSNGVRANVDGGHKSQEADLRTDLETRGVNVTRNEGSRKERVISEQEGAFDEKQQREFWERWRQEQQEEERSRVNHPATLSCILGPWTSWAGPVGFGVIERRRSVVGGDEGCMTSEGDLVMRVDISVFNDKNTYYKTPEAVGQDFEADFTRSHEPRDLLLVLDASGSIEADDFRLMKEGVELMVELFCGGFGPSAENNRLAVIVFASDIDVVYRFSDDQSPATIRNAISNMTQPNGNTCTGDALRFAHDVVYAPENGARADVVHDTLLVTDGHSNCGKVTVQEGANLLHNVSNVFALGVGVANDTAARWELNSVVSNRDPRHIFSLLRFQDFKGMLQSIQHRRGQDSCLPIVADTSAED